MTRGLAIAVTLDDVELMRRVQADDLEAFAVLYDRFCARAYRLAAAIARDKTRAEDIVQEAFVSLWLTRARYQPQRGAVTTWRSQCRRTTFRRPRYHRCPSSAARMTAYSPGSMAVPRLQAGRGPYLGRGDGGVVTSWTARSRSWPKARPSWACPVPTSSRPARPPRAPARSWASSAGESLPSAS